ncbi:hypothetical protein PGN35_008770 [Nodosilinea sp. PGN35]
MGHRDWPRLCAVAQPPDPPLIQIEHLAMGKRWVTAERGVDDWWREQTTA